MGNSALLRNASAEIRALRRFLELANAELRGWRGGHQMTLAKPQAGQFEGAMAPDIAQELDEAAHAMEVTPESEGRAPDPDFTEVD